MIVEIKRRDNKEIDEPCPCLDKRRARMNRLLHDSFANIDPKARQKALVRSVERTRVHFITSINQKERRENGV